MPRKKGIPNKRTARATKVIDANKHDPLVVQLMAMNALVEKAAGLAGDEQLDARIEVLKEAAEVAAKITPYKHARLSSIDAKVHGTITHESLLDQLAAYAADDHERSDDPPGSTRH